MIRELMIPIMLIFAVHGVERNPTDSLRESSNPAMVDQSVQRLLERPGRRLRSSEGEKKKHSQPSIATTVITIIIDQVLFHPPFIKGTGKGCPSQESITKIFPNCVQIAVQDLAFESFINSIRSRILLLFLQIEQHLPEHWNRDKVLEKRINSINDVAYVFLEATRKTAYGRSMDALPSYGIDGDDIGDCGQALFHSRPGGRAKEWIHVSFTVQDQPDMIIFLQKDANDQIPLDVSAKMTLGDVRQTGNLRSGRFSFGDQEYTERDDSTALADLGICAESTLRFTSWIDVKVQIDALYFYPSRKQLDKNHPVEEYWISSVPWMDFWKLPITVKLKLEPGSTFQSLTDLLRLHILNNMIHELPTEWRLDEFRMDKPEDVFLSITPDDNDCTEENKRRAHKRSQWEGSEEKPRSSTVWALKKHGICMDLKGDKQISTWKCGNTAFYFRDDHRKEYAHIVFSVKDM